MEQSCEQAFPLKAFAQKLWDQAKQQEDRAGNIYQGESYKQAREAYAHVERLYEQARREGQAQSERERQVTITAREKALGAQQQAVAGKDLFANQWQEADSVFVAASEAFARQEWNGAQAGFTHSGALFQHIRYETELRL